MDSWDCPFVVGAASFCRKMEPVASGRHTEGIVPPKLETWGSVVCASSQTRSTFRFSSYGAASVEQGCASRWGETRSDTSVSASLTPEEPRGCSRVLSFRQDPPFGVLYRASQCIRPTKQSLRVAKTAEDAGGCRWLWDTTGGCRRGCRWLWDTTGGCRRLQEAAGGLFAVYQRPMLWV